MVKCQGEFEIKDVGLEDRFDYILVSPYYLFLFESGDFIVGHTDHFFEYKFVVFTKARRRFAYA